MTAMDLVVGPGGNVNAIYGEAIDLHSIGTPKIQRGSHVEPDRHGRWTADLSPVGGPLLGPYVHRSEALAAEVDWLRRHWLLPSEIS